MRVPQTFRCQVILVLWYYGIMSHQNFNFGHDMSHYPRPSTGMMSFSFASLRLPATAKSVHISFISFKIGNSTTAECKRAFPFENQLDELIIYNGLAKALYSCAGVAISPSDQTFLLNSAELIFQLNVRKSGGDFSGFFIRYQGE